MNILYSARLTLMLLCLLLTPSCSRANLPATSPADAYLAAIEQYSDAFMARGGTPGLVVAFLAPNAEKPVVLARGMACLTHAVPMQPNTVMRFASVTKAVTALRVKRCIDAGLLQYDTDVRAFFPQLNAPAPITVRQLLTHTSGLPDIFSLPEIRQNPLLPLSQKEIVQRLDQQPMLFAPGTQQAYNNAGYIVLNLLLEQEPFRATGALRGPGGLAEKLGMTAIRHGNNTSVVPHMACGYTLDNADKLAKNAVPILPMPINADFAYGTGDLLGTAESMLALAQAAKAVRVTGYEPENLVPHTLSTGEPAIQPFPELGWNESLTEGLVLLLFPDGSKLVGKDGLYPGYVAQFWLDPATGAAVAVMVNQEKAFLQAKQLAINILKGYRNAGFATAR